MFRKHDKQVYLVVQIVVVGKFTINLFDFITCSKLLMVT